MCTNLLSNSHWQIPTFGNDTIWKFSTNISELKKLAAFNFEDLLQVGLPWGLSTRSIWPDYHECQCSIPVFDGLLLKLHNSVTLLFMCCSWNRLAKLWIHTGWILDIFDGVTNMIGAELHHSATITCKAFPTKELWQEMNGCQHQALKKNGDGNTLPTVCSGQYLGSLPKKFNINISRTICWEIIPIRSTILG